MCFLSVGSAIQQGVLCRIIHQNLDTVPLAEDVNLRMLASRYLTMEQGCWGVCVTNRTLVIMASVCDFDMCVSCAWCLILRKKWHSIRYMLPNSECARNLNWMSTDSKCYSICEARPFILYVTGSVTQLLESVDVYRRHMSQHVWQTRPRVWLKQFKVAQLDVFRQYELQPAWISHRQHSVSGTIHFISRLTRFPVFYSRSLCSTQ